MALAVGVGHVGLLRSFFYTRQVKVRRMALGEWRGKRKAWKGVAEMAVA